MTPTESEAMRRAAEARSRYWLWLANALTKPQAEASRVMLCAEAAHELRSIAEGVRVNPDSQEDDKPR